MDGLTGFEGILWILDRFRLPVYMTMVFDKICFHADVRISRLYCDEFDFVFNEISESDIDSVSDNLLCRLFLF